MHDKRTAMWFGAFVVVVLLIGVASGILLDRFLIPGPADRAGRAGGPNSAVAPRQAPRGMRQGPADPGAAPGSMRAGLEDRLAQQLDLTAAQKEQVAAILGRRRVRLDEVRGEVQKRMAKEQADLLAEIRGVLTESQKQRFDEAMVTVPGFGRRGPGERGMRRGGAPGRQE